MRKFIYDISLQKFLNENGDILYNVQPLLVFGEKPTWKIKIKSNREDVDISEVTAWASAVAEDYNPLTVPMCRTVSDIEVEDGFVVVPLNTRTESFRAKTANRSVRSCIFELVGLNGDGESCIHVSFGVLCKISLDPMATGDLPPIEVTEMTSSQVQAIATGAARDEVEEIQEEIEQSKQDAQAAAEEAQEAASSITEPTGATVGQVLTVQDDGIARFSDPLGGTVDSELSTTSENPVQNKAIASAVNGITDKIPSSATAQNQLADKDFVNSSINNMAAFYITKDAAGNPFGTKAELNAATQYYSGGVSRTPTKNDYTVVLHDESKGTIYAGYADFTATDDYIGYWVVSGADNAAYLVDSANKDAIGIVPGTTVAYVVLPSTRYLYDSQWQYQYIVNNSGLTAAQWAVLNSGITAEKVAQIDSALQGGYIAGHGSLSVSNKILQIPRSGESSYGVMGRTKAANGVYQSGEWTIVSTATNAQIDARNSDTRVIKPSSFPYAVRSVSPLITALPSDAASPIALTDASATTRNHSYIYTHAPSTAPTYQLPAVSDATIAHEIVLYLDLTTVASFAFTDSAGATIAVDTNGVTPALGEKWTVWTEYVHGAWIVRGMRDKEATA